VYGLSETALAPQAPAWRLLDFADDSAERLATRLQRFAWVNAGMTSVMVALLGDAVSRPSLGAVCAIVLSTVGVIFVVPMLRADAWRAREVEGRSAQLGGGWWTFGRAIVRLAMASAVIAALAARPSLAAHIYFSMFLSAAAIGVALVLHGLARDVVAAVTAPDTSSGRWARRITRQAEDAPLGGQLLLLLAFDLVLLLLLAVVLPTIWGADTDDLGEWLWKLLTGIRIGEKTISLVDIGVAIGTFVVTVFVIGLLRKGLRDRVLPSIQVQDAVRYSIDAAVNYAGIALAGMFAITALGVDFSNLALIIGALSVGIGLGLQSVANNTISGIILLLERPIKVGDWVIVGEHEGTVKRINIRATEIETFRRATVIVPNADFLQKAVVNWTYADQVGRIEVPIVVAIWTDVATVEAALLAAAGDCRNLALTPRPHVMFRRIGDRGLEFELRAYVGNVANSLAARNALNRAVVERLRAADVRLIAEEPPLAPEPARHAGPSHDSPEPPKA
jgi:potassium efflux system protein